MGAAWRALLLSLRPPAPLQLHTGLSPKSFSSFMDGGIGGASLFQEALGAPLSAQRPLTSHRRSPRLLETESPLWKEGVCFLAGSEVADMLM